MIIKFKCIQAVNGQLVKGLKRTLVYEKGGGQEG